MQQLQFDESKPCEILRNWNGLQVLRLNTSDAEIFVKEGTQFIADMPKYVDSEGQVKILYVFDVLPPLSAILRLAEFKPEKAVTWSPSAVIKPEDTTVFDKIIPVVLWGVNLTAYKNNYSLQIFDHKCKFNLEPVIKWFDEQIENNPHRERLPESFADAE